MKRKLCPRRDEPMTYVGFHLPNSVFGKIESLRRNHIQTRAEVVRTLIFEALRARGRFATDQEMGEPA